MRQENQGDGKEHLGATPEAGLGERVEVAKLPVNESDEADVAVPFSDHEIFSEEANAVTRELLEITSDARRVRQPDAIYDRIERVLSRSELTTDSGALHKVIKALND